MERYQEYIESEIEWIDKYPASWKLVNLSSLVDQRKNKNTDLQESNALSLSFGKIKRRKQDNSGLLPESFDTYNIIEEGDVVLRLTDLQNDKVSLRVGRSDERGAITSAYTTLIPRADSRYLFYQLAAFDYWKGFYGLAGGVRQSLNYDGIKNLRFLLPSNSEQSVIANYLDVKTSEIDSLIEDTEKSIELLEEYRKSVISEAVTKGLDPDAPIKESGIEWVGKVPEYWTVEALGLHSTMLTPMRDKPEDLSGPIPWVRIEDYSGKYLSNSKAGYGVSRETIAEMNLKVYPVGTVLCTSSCDLGKAAIITEPLVSNQRFIGIIPGEDLSSDYLYYLMLASAERLNSLSTGTIQANLSRKSFEHLKLPFPELSEQIKIAAYLDRETDAIETLIDNRRRLKDLLDEYRKALVSEAVTGKIRVTEVY